jgi:hypothetical protein
LKHAIKTMPEDQRQTGPGEILFRRIVSVSTALSLAVAYGWLAGFVRQANGDLNFQWRWLVAVWAVIGLVTTIYFWRKIWPPGDGMATRRGVLKGALALVLPGVWWLIFPLRSQSGQHLWQVVEGLIAAALVLTFGAWMIIRLGRAFEDK